MSRTMDNYQVKGEKETSFAVPVISSQPTPIRLAAAQLPVEDSSSVSGQPESRAPILGQLSETFVSKIKAGRHSEVFFIDQDGIHHDTTKITLYNVCSVHRGMFSTSGGVQYIGGIP